MIVTKEKVLISKDEFKKVLEEGLSENDVWCTFVEWLTSELKFDVNVENVYQWILSIVDWEINEDGSWNYSFIYDDEEEFEFDTDLIIYWDYDEFLRIKEINEMIANTDDRDEIDRLYEELWFGGTYKEKLFG